MRQVLPARRVPRRHVLLHAVGVAGRFARGERGAGRGDAAVEAVFVEFLKFPQSQNRSSQKIEMDGGVNGECVGLGME